MNDFVQIFQSAMELCCLGLYEKSQSSGVHAKKEGFIYSPLLKKALDKFSLLTLVYSLYDDNGEPIFPTDEAALIKSFNFPVSEMIDRLPPGFCEPLMKTEWYMEEAFVNVGLDNYFYCTPELLDLLNETIFRKAKDAPFKELELQSQKFIRLLFEREQDEYEEIRNFLQQKEFTYLTSQKFIEYGNVRGFKEK